MQFDFENVWIQHANHDVYYYYGGGAICSGIVIDNANSAWNIESNNKWIWKPNDILTININLDEWRITFFLNEKKIGQSIEVENNDTYHAVMCTQCHDTQYKLFY